MTRKDYILIAEALKGARLEVIRGGAYSIEGRTKMRDGIDRAADYMASAMAQDNPRFSREHFLAVVRGEREVGSKPERKQ